MGNVYLKETEHLSSVGSSKGLDDDYAVLLPGWQLWQVTMKTVARIAKVRAVAWDLDINFCL